MFQGNGPKCRLAHSTPFLPCSKIWLVPQAATLQTRVVWRALIIEALLDECQLPVGIYTRTGFPRNVIEAELRRYLDQDLALKGNPALGMFQNCPFLGASNGPLWGTAWGTQGLTHIRTCAAQYTYACHILIVCTQELEGMRESCKPEDPEEGTYLGATNASRVPFIVIHAYLTATKGI